jgi:O-antigen/teichoic acid export membrane protein
MIIFIFLKNKVYKLMPYFSFIISNVALIFFVTALLGFISMIISILIARELDVSSFGLYSMFIAFGSILGIFMEGGAKHLIQRSGNNKIINNNLKFNSLIISQLKTIILINFIILFFGSIFYKHFIFEIMLTSLCFSGNALYQLFSYHLKGQEKFFQDSFWNISNRIFSGLSIIFVLYFFQSSIKGLFLAWSIPVFIIIFIIIKFNKISFNWEEKPSFINYRRLFPLLLIDISLILSIKIDFIIMGLINYSSNEVGLYAAGFKIIEIIIILAIPTSIVLFKLFKKEFEILHKFPVFTFLFMFLGAFIGLVFTIIIINFIDQIILLIYGTNYLDADKYALDLSYLPIIIIPNIIMFQAILANNNELIYSKILLISCLAHILISMMFNNNNSIIYNLNGIYLNQIITLLGSLIIILKNYIPLKKNYLS